MSLRLTADSESIEVSPQDWLMQLGLLSKLCWVQGSCRGHCWASRGLWVFQVKTQQAFWLLVGVWV
jgi:hypothetical protein